MKTKINTYQEKSRDEDEKFGSLYLKKWTKNTKVKTRINKPQLHSHQLS